jgi:LPS-assembly lipoprotein
MKRRRWIAALPLLALGGCGFQLRRVASLSFGSIALVGFPQRSPLAEELRAVLSRTVVVEPAPAQADVVLQALSDVRSKKAVAFTASGQVRDVQLSTLLKYRAHTPTERPLIPDSEIVLYRDMTYIEARALGKEQEEQLLYREMQSDLVLQVMLRLSAIKL